MGRAAKVTAGSGAWKEAVFFAIDHLIDCPKRACRRVSSKVGAISLFEKLNDTTALVHFEKGSRIVKVSTRRSMMKLLPA